MVSSPNSSKVLFRIDNPFNHFLGTRSFVGSDASD